MQTLHTWKLTINVSHYCGHGEQSTEEGETHDGSCKSHYFFLVIEEVRLFKILLCSSKLERSKLLLLEVVRDEVVVCD